LAFKQRSPSDGPPTSYKSSSLCNLDVFWRKAKACSKHQHVVLRLSDCNLIRLAEPSCRFDQCLEHRPEVESRPTNDLEHVGRGSLLRQRLVQLAAEPHDLGFLGFGGGTAAAHSCRIAALWHRFAASPFSRFAACSGAPSHRPPKA